MKEDEADTYVYYEHPFSQYKYNNDNLMWRYWAAKEMANNIIDEPGEFITVQGYYVYGMDYIHRPYLIQMLKKEWFR